MKHSGFMITTHLEKENLIVCNKYSKGFIKRGYYKVVLANR